MKLSKKNCLLLILSILFFYAGAQSNMKTYSLKKGQVFDVLLRNNNYEASDEVKKQFDEKVIPRILKHGYQVLPHGLSFEKVAIQGNYSPGHMVVGGWENLETRENAMQILEKEVPNFHQIRRELWTTLFSTYYELENDLDFTIKKEKFYVVTAYKYKKKRPFQIFIKSWLNNITESNGKIILNLTNGKSPFIGHYYEPNHFSITEWDSKADFDKFFSANMKMKHSSIKYVNQFALNPKF